VVEYRVGGQARPDCLKSELAEISGDATASESDVTNQVNMSEDALRQCTQRVQCTGERTAHTLLCMCHTASPPQLLAIWLNQEVFP